jgi:phosphoglucomutase
MVCGQFYLNLIAVTGKSVNELVSEHWTKFGRNYYSRHDYEAVDLQKATQLISNLRGKLAELKGKEIKSSVIENVNDFSYHDPIDGSVTEKQGI